MLVSPHRTQRPWQGEVSQTDTKPPCTTIPTAIYAPATPVPAASKTLPYTGVFAFTNDYAALLPDSPGIAQTGTPLLRAESERGVCRVLCFHPDHSLTLPAWTCDDIVARGAGLDRRVHGTGRPPGNPPRADL